MSQTKKIRQKAYQLGFDLCGFTADFVPQQRDYFLNWLAQKRYADMGWLGVNVDKRLQPDTILESTKSVLVLACSYAHEPVTKDYALARYAHGEDYHLWMKLKLETLATWIQSDVQNDFLWRSFVDTGPVLERDLAAKAGLGWIGKNTNLLNSELGSYLFLGVIFSNLQFTANIPVVDACGSCTLCLDACPTQALTSYQLNPAKCLAYHNIEKRGVRDRDFWQALGDNLVGCDICQEVCPYNHDVQATKNQDWLSSFQQHALGDLQNILRMTEVDYKQKIKNSAISRIKYTDLLRNVFLVIANTKRKDLYADVLAWQNRHTEILEECTWCLEILQKL